MPAGSRTSSIGSGPGSTSASAPCEPAPRSVHAVGERLETGQRESPFRVGPRRRHRSEPARACRPLDGRVRYRLACLRAHPAADHEAGLHPHVSQVDLPLGRAHRELDAPPGLAGHVGPQRVVAHGDRVDGEAAVGARVGAQHVEQDVRGGMPRDLADAHAAGQRLVARVDQAPDDPRARTQRDVQLHFAPGVQHDVRHDAGREPARPHRDVVEARREPGRLVAPRGIRPLRRGPAVRIAQRRDDRAGEGLAVRTRDHSVQRRARLQRQLDARAQRHRAPPCGATPARAGDDFVSSRPEPRQLEPAARVGGGLDAARIRLVCRPDRVRLPCLHADAGRGLARPAVAHDAFDRAAGPEIDRERSPRRDLRERAPREPRRFGAHAMRGSASDRELEAALRVGAGPDRRLARLGRLRRGGDERLADRLSVRPADDPFEQGRGSRAGARPRGGGSGRRRRRGLASDRHAHETGQNRRDGREDSPSAHPGSPLRRSYTIRRGKVQEGRRKETGRP